MADDYTYQQTDNMLADGGLSPDFVHHIMAVGGPELLTEVLKKAGRNIALALHTDVLKRYCEERGIKYNKLAEDLSCRSTQLITAKDLKNSDLEKLAREMPQGTGGDDELLAQASVLIDELQGQVTGVQTQYDALRGKYAETLTEIAGRFTGSTLDPLLRQTLEILKKGAVSATATAELERLTRELKETEKRVATVTRQYDAAQREKAAASTARDTAQRELRAYKAAAEQTEVGYKTKLAQAEQHKKRLEIQNGTLSTVVEQLRREGETAGHERGALTAQVAALQQEMRRTQSLLEKAVRGEELGEHVAVCLHEEDFYLRLAQRYFKERKYNRLYTLLETSLKNIPENDTLKTYRRNVINDLYELGKKAAGQKDYADARAYYRQVIQFEPGHLKAHLKMAESYEAQGGRSGEVRHFYDKVLALDPKNPFAREGLERLKLKE